MYGSVCVCGGMYRVCGGMYHVYVARHVCVYYHAYLRRYVWVCVYQRKVPASLSMFSVEL